MPESQPSVLIPGAPSQSRSIFLSVTMLFFLLLVIWFIFAPINFYLNLNSRFYPQAVEIGNNTVSWQQLSDELKFISFDPSLKTRQQKIQQAIKLSVERVILRQTVTPTVPTSELSAVDEYQTRKKKVEENFVNWRTGGVFIARFNVFEATESANELKLKAHDEILKIQDRLKKGEDMKKIVEDANNNPTLKYLDQAAFIPGMYLDQITADKFPVEIKTFRDAFFKLPDGSVSDIVTLSWDDYDGPDVEGFKGEFGYGVARVDKVNLEKLRTFDSWMQEQKLNLGIKSHVFIPFYFRWL